MTRFLYSSSSLKDADTCLAKFRLNQTGAEKGGDATNLRFGQTFHRVMELYLNHCLGENRHSDVSILPDLVSQAFTESGLSLRFFDELLSIAKGFSAVYRVDLERSISREGGIAFDEHLNVLEWDGSLEYDAMDAPADSKGEAFFRAKLDHVLLDPETKTLEIHDYKTDIFIPSRSAIAEMSSRFYQQARLYAWAAHRAIYPAEVIEVVFLFSRYTAFGRPVTRKVVFHRADIDEIQQSMLARIKHIEGLDFFPPTPGNHCQICPFASTQCPAQDLIPAETPADRMRRFLFLEAERDQIRTELKDDVALYGYDGELGPLRAHFEQQEKRIPDMKRVWDAITDLGIEHPWALMSFSETSARKVLEKEDADLLVDAAYDGEVTLRFNVHQKKDALVALAEERGIDTEKKTVKQLAAELAASVVTEPLEIDPEGIVEVEEGVA